MEIAPGIHRIESILGPRPFSQYLLADESCLLVDTGVATTPQEVILPFLDALGRDPATLDMVLLSHADVDHFGGDELMRRAAPRAAFCAHEADVPWITDRERIMRERYGWYAAHGIGYPPETAAWLRDALGADVPVDIAVTGGEVIRLGSRLSVRVLHLPGHSAGHIGLWEPRSRTAIVQDAVMANGLLDMEGRVIHPPPYFDAAAYEGSARLLMRLEPDRLLTAHYPVIEGTDVDRFLDDTIEFVREARDVVEEIVIDSREVTLKEVLEQADSRLGPFTSMRNELAGPLRAHLRELVAAGRRGVARRAALAGGMNRLAGEVAIVTGAAQGLGAAIAGVLEEEGARVARTDLTGAEFALDVRVRRSVEAAVEEIAGSLGSPSVLVNNAGLNRIGPSEELTEERWREVLDTNLTGTFFCCQSVGRRMLEARRGSIVNVASIIGETGVPGRAPYSASKAGIVGLTRVLAVEWARRGVRVNAVAPGYTRTPMVAHAIASGLLSEESLRDRTPAERLAEPEEIARAVAFLASSEAAFVTGQTLVVDGGWLAYGAAGPASDIPVTPHSP